MDQDCILIHYHELALKKNNKVWFERIFQKNIRIHLKTLPFKNINTYASRVFIYGVDTHKWIEYKEKLKNVMGLKNAPLMHKVDADIEKIKAVSKKIIEKIDFGSFRITTKRQDKGFKWTSHDLNQIIGETIQKICKKPVSLKKAVMASRINTLLSLPMLLSMVMAQNLY